MHFTGVRREQTHRVEVSRFLSERLGFDQLRSLGSASPFAEQPSTGTSVWGQWVLQAFYLMERGENDGRRI